MSRFPVRGKAGLFFVATLLLVASSVPPSQALVVPNIPPTPIFGSESLATPDTLRSPQGNELLAAKAHLARNSHGWGIDPSQFEATLVVPGLSGMSTVRFIQKIAGLEVIGSVLAITVSKNGAMLSYTLAASSYAGSTNPRLSQTQAMLSTKQVISKSDSESDSTVSDLELVVADSALMSEILFGQKLLWRSTTSVEGNLTTISTTYLDDATGTLVSSLPLVRGISADPLVCDLQNLADNPLRGVYDIAGMKFVNISSGAIVLPLCGTADAVTQNDVTTRTKTHVIKAWDFFSSLGLDINEEKFLGNVSASYNGDLTPRISTFVNVCATGATIGNQCPFVNAFWVPWTSADCASGACSGIFLGAALSNADDVIAHELAHGVTFALAFYAGLNDTSETAALSEAISDIFGEATDQLTLDPGELVDPSWTLGEDVLVGGFRNMQSPKVQRITKGWAPADSHENSGPVNRLAWLLANGGKSGKFKIKALNKDPATAIRMLSSMTLTTTSHLTPSASYIDFGREFINACNVNVINKTRGYSKKVCKNVATAVKAQGFTKFSIRALTKVGTVAKNSPTKISATAVSGTGAPFSGQELALQYKSGSKWKTVAKGNTDGNGNISFTATWSRSVTYRIASKTNAGFFVANSATARVKVK